jgi:hypothetical protein
MKERTLHAVVRLSVSDRNVQAAGQDWRKLGFFPCSTGYSTIAVNDGSFRGIPKRSNDPVGSSVIGERVSVTVEKLVLREMTTRFSKQLGGDITFQSRISPKEIFGKAKASIDGCLPANRADERNISIQEMNSLSRNFMFPPGETELGHRISTREGSWIRLFTLTS